MSPHTCIRNHTHTTICSISIGQSPERFSCDKFPIHCGGKRATYALYTCRGCSAEYTYCRNPGVWVWVCVGSYERNSCKCFLFLGRMWVGMFGECIVVFQIFLAMCQRIVDAKSINRVQLADLTPPSPPAISSTRRCHLLF